MPTRQTGKSADGNNPANRQKSLIGDAYRKIKHLIFTQRLIPGQRLVCDDLARMLEISSTPVINALNRLEQQGLVVSESYRGFYVKAMDIQEARETIAVKQAIEHSKAGDFNGLEKNLSNMNKTFPITIVENIFLDAQIHLQIAQMTGNRTLNWHLKTIMEHVYLRAGLNNYDRKRMKTSAKQHRELVIRIINKDILRSVDLIRRHVQQARDHTIACLFGKVGEKVGFNI